MVFTYIDHSEDSKDEDLPQEVLAKVENDQNSSMGSQQMEQERPHRVLTEVYEA